MRAIRKAVFGALVIVGGTALNAHADVRCLMLLKHTAVALLAILLFAPFSIAEAEDNPTPRSELKGIQYGFSSAAECKPEKFKSGIRVDWRNVFVVFYGDALSGWNNKKNRPYPSSPRIYSRIYQFCMPASYDWRARHHAPQTMTPLFHEYLIKKYGFTKDEHDVGFFFGNSLSDVERQLGEDFRHMEYVSPKTRLIADTEFTFTFKDTHTPGVRPLVIEYNGPGPN